MFEIVADWYGGSTSVGFSRREPMMVLAAVVVMVGWVAVIPLLVTWMVEMVADWYGGSTSVGFSRREPMMVLAAVVVMVGWVALFRSKLPGWLR